ncbi:MAG: glycoside hydrolase family 3 C-terminal domain-containing protein [Acidobacteriota bacterium]|nr:glycoside hydrolase family 3 C-terminal domain-containing protein [Acidobacteriota bacterium]
MRTRLAVAFSVLCLATFCNGYSQSVPSNAPYKNPKLSADARADDLLKRMTLEEKATMLAGSGWMESAPIERLGIPAIHMADGPLGVRSWMGSSAITNASSNPVKIESTAFPSGVAMAATWDPALVEREGKEIGEEVKALGRDMILGPTVNINRQPLWGRNFEGYGEDPYLTSQLGVAYIFGVQSEGVIPSVKHFIANNQEFERHRINVVMDERTLHEIYLPAFKAAVQQANVWTVMSAYNKLNGTYCAENEELLNTILKRELGFKGFVISDWGSTYSTAPTVNAGMDLEMPGGEPARKMIASPRSLLAGNSGTWLERDKVLAAMKAGQISEATLDDNVRRILRVIFLSGIFDHPHPAGGPVDTPEQQAVALQGATEGIVLLKNEHALLPIEQDKVHSLAVIGPNAATARTGGGGSSMVRPKFAISPLDGIKTRAAKAGITVTYALGVGMEGEDSASDTPEAREAALQEAVDVASKADVAVVVVGRYWKNESEGFDVKTMDLPAGQDALIEAVEKANPRTVVVLNTGDPVTMTQWLDTTPALLDMWYGGEEGGAALASILFGDANPSGKLPVTLPRRFEDSPAAANYPGKDLTVHYAEGIYVGYRYYDTKKVEPAFPFGYGLRYTSFAYSGLKVTPRFSVDQSVAVSLRVRNTGKRAGAEVVQVYVHDGHSKIDRPVHELKGFEKVDLMAGESKTVTLKLDRAAFSYWNPATKRWQADPGTFEVQVGASSRDIRLRAPVVLER